MRVAEALGVGLDSPRLSERAISIARASSPRSPHQRIKEGKNPSYSDEVRRGLARHYILVSCPFQLRCSTSLYRVSSSLAWCCLRSRPRALIKSQFNERRGAAPGALFSQSKPSRNRVLYHRQLEPNVTLLPSIRSGHPRLSMCCLCFVRCLVYCLCPDRARPPSLFVLRMEDVRMGGADPSAWVPEGSQIKIFMVSESEILKRIGEGRT